MKAVRAFLRLVDGISTVVSWLAMAAVVLLVGTMTVEVVSRRLLNSPTMWAYDVSYMSNGAIFVLGLAYVFRFRQHINIDFLAARMPPRLRNLVEALFFGLLLLPILLLVGQVAWADAIEAFRTARVERVSPWAPLVWPYLGVIAVGVGALALQTIAETVRSAAGALGIAELAPVRGSEAKRA